jgi:UDP-2,3-diacylglucosamine hydrolase
MNPTAIIVADSHFHLLPDEKEQQRIVRFCELLEMACRADHLVLLGDIFDFWFDYPHFRLRGYETILQALDRVREAGTEIHFIGGNHDIWAAGYMHQRYGCRPDGEPLTLQLGSHRLYLTHGDGLLGFDWLYNTFRAMVRTRAGIVLAKSLHPEILYHISEWLSGTSRGATRDEAPEIEAKGARWLARHPSDQWDVMVMGHVHHAFTVSNEGQSLSALAGWFDTLGYALFQDGQIHLLDFDRDPHPEL